MRNKTISLAQLPLLDIFQIWKKKSDSSPSIFNRTWLFILSPSLSLYEPSSAHLCVYSQLSFWSLKQTEIHTNANSQLKDAATLKEVSKAILTCWLTSMLGCLSKSSTTSDTDKNNTRQFWMRDDAIHCTAQRSWRNTEKPEFLFCILHFYIGCCVTIQDLLKYWSHPKN